MAKKKSRPKFPRHAPSPGEAGPPTPPVPGAAALTPAAGEPPGRGPTHKGDAASTPSGLDVKGRKNPSCGPIWGRVTLSIGTPEQKEQWGLPQEPDKPGDWLVELNLLHPEGLQGADRRFNELYERVITREGARKPIQVSNSYYSCLMSEKESHDLVLADDQVPEPRMRAIFRIWPDFLVTPQVDASVATVKADAAGRSYDATGAGIVWAVVDSGIEQGHPHLANPEFQTLSHPDVAQLHRDFTVEFDSKNANPEQIQENVQSALRDEYGHGTHVAGIIAGGLTRSQAPVPTDLRIYERVIESNESGMQNRDRERVEVRKITDPARLRGVAPRCKLVSLKVLNSDGGGRASNVMVALQYIREKVNGDGKLLRIHGVNLSVGYEFDAEMFACGQSPLCVEVDRLVRAGVVVVVAAGNTGYGKLDAQKRQTRTGLMQTINDPGNASSAITVGATHRDSPHTYGVSFFSSKGPTGDGRLKPDLVAPGERITSCATGSWLEDIRAKLRLTRGGLDQRRLGLGTALEALEAEQADLEAMPDRALDLEARLGDVRRKVEVARRQAAQAQDQVQAADREIEDLAKQAVYIDYTGTSMAAPHVSGVIAAFLSIRREFIQRPEEVKRIFLESATSLGREQYFEGHGLVDLMRAIQSV